MKVNGLVTQGAPEDDVWVTSYEIEFSDKNRDDWVSYIARNGRDPLRFKANYDRYSLVEGQFESNFETSGVSIEP